MSVLITSDIHLTDNPRDKYRWNLLPWLGEQAKKYQVDKIFILGDLTDSKDRHSASLVNAFVTSIIKLASECPVILLKGNHDYIDENTPFFMFTNSLPNVE